MKGVVYRRRLKVKTPSISTYEKQLQQCEKRFKRITLTIPTINEPDEVVNANYRIPEAEVGQDSFQQCISCAGSRNVFRRKSFNKSNRLGRRKSSLCTLSQLETPEVQRSSPSLRASLCSHHDKNRITPKNGSPFPAKEANSRRRLKVDASRNEYHNRDGNDNMKADSRVPLTLSSEYSQSLIQHQEYFIRALTTLAINNLTSSKPPAEERRASTNLYNRNINILLGTPNLHDFASPQQQQHRMQNSIKQQFDNDKHEVSSSIESSDSSTEEDEKASDELDKRGRINRLRNYLKCTGLGEPVLVTVCNEETEESKKELFRLVRKVHRGLSPEKQQRLKLKTHLEYEMSLMKGESFCEQQDQVIMRSASADMGDRDQQLLEEEMKAQLLQELNSKDDLDNVANINARRWKEPGRIGVERKVNLARRSVLAPPTRSKDDDADVANYVNGDKADYRLLPDMCADDGDLGMSETAGQGGDDDILSGVLRSPFSRREMRRRVFTWVNDVESAMGLEWKERMRVNYDIHRRKKQACDTENDDLINKVMRANAINDVMDL